MNDHNNTILQIHNVSVSFGKRMIFDSVNLAVPERSIIALTGKSGSGKSTLLGIMSGLLKPHQGEVLFSNENIFKWSDWKRSRFRNREIGFVFQFFNLLPDKSAYQNILYPSSLNVLSRRNTSGADYLVDQLGLQQIKNQYPSTLSGGELQRVAIARAIINRPRLVLADEPTGNLDDETASDIIKLFFDIREQYGISFIIVTHDNEIVNHADYHYHLENGVLSRVNQKKTGAPKKTKEKTTAQKTKSSSSKKAADTGKSKTKKPDQSLN